MSERLFAGKSGVEMLADILPRPSVEKLTLVWPLAAAGVVLDRLGVLAIT